MVGGTLKAKSETSQPQITNGRLGPGKVDREIEAQRLNIKINQNHYVKSI